MHESQRLSQRIDAISVRQLELAAIPAADFTAEHRTEADALDAERSPSTCGGCLTGSWPR